MVIFLIILYSFTHSNFIQNICTLNQEIHPVSFTLISFEIITLRVIPNLCATIDIIIHSSHGQLYDRSFTLSGKAYTDWTCDDYSYKYVTDNIDDIYNECVKME